MSVTFVIRVCVCDTHQEKEAQNLMEKLGTFEMEAKEGKIVDRDKVGKVNLNMKRRHSLGLNKNMILSLAKFIPKLKCRNLHEISQHCKFSTWKLMWGWQSNLLET